MSDLGPGGDLGPGSDLGTAGDTGAEDVGTGDVGSVGPRVLSTIPTEGASDVATGASTVSLTFSEPMDATQTALGLASRRGMSGAMEVLPVIWIDGGRTATLEVTLVGGTNYSVLASSLIDSSGRQLLPGPVLVDGRGRRRHATVHPGLRPATDGAVPG